MLLTQDLERNSQEATNLRSKVLILKTQIENISQENGHLRENMKSEINSLQQEIITLRNSMQSVNEENDNSLLKQKITSQERSYFNLEKRIKFSATENYTWRHCLVIIKMEIRALITHTTLPIKLI